MRPIVALVAAALASVALTAGCSTQSTPTDSAASASAATSAAVAVMAPQEFLAAAAPDEVVMVDVRSPEEFDAGHVAGALNINVESGDFAAAIADLPHDTSYALYCRSGRRSALAAEQMAAAGFTSLITLGGGIADVEAAGATITTE